MKNILIILNIFIILSGNAFSNIENPMSQWTDVLLVRKSWIYAIRVGQNNNIELSQSKVIPEIDANVMQKILENLAHEFDLEKIRDEG
jgi:hypothetical protein